MKYKKLIESVNVPGIEKRNEIFLYVKKNSNPSKLYDNKLDIILNADGIYEIHAHELHLHPDDEEFKYPIRYCDELCLYGKKIKSFVNLPLDPYMTSMLIYKFDGCDSLDFRDLHLISKKYYSIVIKNTLNINPNHLPFDNSDMRILNCTGDVLYDFEKYDVRFTNLTLGLGAKLKNVPYILKTRLQRCALSLKSDFYSSSQLQTMENIIFNFIRRNNREEYIMDMTVELIDSGFEDEV